MIWQFGNFQMVWQSQNKWFLQLQCHLKLSIFFLDILQLLAIAKVEECKTYG